MNKILFFAAIGCIIVLLLTTCKGVSSGNQQMPTDSVAWNKLQVGDTTSFPLISGKRCTIQANALISYPNKYVDNETTSKLQKLFAQAVLESGDSISFQEALKQYAKQVVGQYDVEDDLAKSINQKVADNEEDDDDTAPTYVIATNIVISVIYNDNDIITFCKEETVKKENEVTLTTHKYYNFDLESISLIDVSTLFKESAINDLKQMLTQQLLAQNNAKKESQLNDIGYYNIDNINVGNNFYFSKDGITWSFLPQDLAIDAVGEPTITLKYRDLKPFITEKSPLNRFF